MPPENGIVRQFDPQAVDGVEKVLTVDHRTLLGSADESRAHGADVPRNTVGNSLLEDHNSKGKRSVNLCRFALLRLSTLLAEPQDDLEFGGF